MHSVRYRLPLLVSLVLGLAACDDPAAFQFDPQIVTDTVELAAPLAAGDSLPTALDIAAPGGVIGGGRFPQRGGDAERWDLAIRARDGGLVFLPAGAAGLESPLLDRAGITQPIMDRSFESIDEAPSSGQFVSDSAVVIQEGAAYVARSRVGTPTCSISYYAKLRPLEVNPAIGNVRLEVVTSARCNDPRLVSED